MIVGFDATPLLGPKTGVGRYVFELVDSLAHEFPDDRFKLWPITWRMKSTRTMPFAQTGTLARAVPSAPNVSLARRLSPARPLHMAWRLVGFPPLEMFLKCDVFHAANFLTPPSLKTPIVITVHDVGFLRTEPHLQSSVAPDKANFRASLKRAAAVIVPSKFTESELLSWMPSLKGRTHVVYEGVSLRGDAMLPSGPTTSSRPGLRILFVGGTLPRKNLSLVFEAAARLADLDPTIEVVGARYPSELLKLPNGVPTGVKVNWRGFVSDSELSSLYRECDVLAYATLYEGFGLPLIEAMASDLSVVALDIEINREIAGDTIRLVRNSPDAFAKAIREVAVAPKDTSAARLRAEQFTWQRMAQQTMDIYRAV